MQHIIDPETMNSLETFSAGLEQFCNFVDIVNKFVWGTVLTAEDMESMENAANELATLTENLSVVGHARDAELSAVIEKIIKSGVPDVGGGGGRMEYTPGRGLL